MQAALAQARAVRLSPRSPRYRSDDNRRRGSPYIVHLGHQLVKVALPARATQSSQAELGAEKARAAAAAAENERRADKLVGRVGTLSAGCP